MAERMPEPLTCPECGSAVTGRTCVCGWYQGGVDRQVRAEWTRNWARRYNDEMQRRRT